MNCVIVDAEPGHVKMLSESLRDGDLLELADFGVRPRNAIWYSYRHSLIRKAAFIDGELAALWGIVGVPLGAVGNLWLLTAPPIERAKFTFVREAQREVAEALEIFPQLFGVVSQRYSAAVKFLTLLGFTIHPASGSLHATFEMKR